MDLIAFFFLFRFAFYFVFYLFFPFLIQAIRHMKFVQIRTRFNVRHSKSMQTPCLPLLLNENFKILTRWNKTQEQISREEKKKIQINIQLKSMFTLFACFFFLLLFGSFDTFCAIETFFRRIQKDYYLKKFHKNSRNFQFQSLFHWQIIQFNKLFVVFFL